MSEIRVLQIVQSMNRGGIENFIMNIYRHIDREKIQFDFLLNEQNRSVFEDEIEALGGIVYRMPRLKLSNPLKYIKAVDKFFKTHPEYKICHSHYNAVSAIPLWLAKHNGIKYRISHSHTAIPKNRKTNKPRVIIWMLKLLLKKVAIHRFACGKEAGKWLYGENAMNNGLVKIVNNAIEVDKFNFNPIIRNNIRKQLDVSDNTIVIGQIGSFSYIKNQHFTIDVLCKLRDIVSDVKCLFVGDGTLRPEIEQYAKELGVADKCIFTGAVSNVCDYAQAMDVFLFPSFFEGLGICAIEAQASGLKCFVSDGVPKECKVTDLVEFLPLSAGADEWAKNISNSCVYDRYGRYEEIRLAGYDAVATAEELQEFYINLLNH